jgi:predicted lipoprotein with Yx(FWY)xxD motif
MQTLRAAFVSCAFVLALAAPAGAIDNLPAGIGGKQLGNGWQFADAKGMTLYTFDRDEGTPGKSGCNGECALAWPPVPAPVDAKPMADWSVITREDGSLQWAYKGMPLYRYAADAFAGSTFGEGVNGTWRIAFEPIPTPGEAKIGATILGQVLTDARGLTLYAFDKDQPGQKSGCAELCLKTWLPLTAPGLANAFGDWSLLVRDNGLRQWAYKGRPLYRHIADVAPGEISGSTIKGWQAVVLEPAPPLPPWATIQSSDAGELIANENGLTVYAHEFNPRNRRRASNCTGDCIDGVDWKPFVAAADAKPTGSWALIDLPDGTKQWTYKGNKLYTNALDTKPGDFKGIRFGGDRSWAAIMRSGQPMQGVTVGG